MGVFTIGEEDPGGAEVARLLAEGEAAMAALYPVESNHVSPAESLRGPDAVFLVAREAGRAVATGAVQFEGAAELGAAEIKRMGVAPDRRATGFGAAMLAALEAAARARGATLLRLETGVASAAALRLYARAGFRARGPFGADRDDPLSVFMEKPLPR
jgi:putative acetyltransferase